MAGKFRVFKGKNGEQYFNLLASNGQVILSSEGYKSMASCKNGIQSVIDNASKENRFESRVAKDGRSYFVMKAGNGQEIGRSQMYKSNSGCSNGIASVGRSAPGAAIVEQ